jgi:toluene monooxygenase system protein A
MLKRDSWLDDARKLDWDFSYVTEEDVFPREVSGHPWLPASEWRGWSEPYRTSYEEYVTSQHDKEVQLGAVHELLGKKEDFLALSPAWLNAVKLHGATVTLAEFAAAIGNLGAARFGRDGSWRGTALMGSLDEIRHTQIPLRFMHPLVRMDAQFDFAHRLYHTENWVAVAARHLVDEMLLLADPIEFAVATHFVFETGFTNLQFIALGAVARATGDRLFEKMVSSIQSDEARHAQIGHPVLEKLCATDRARAQRLVDKWFWRSYRLFAVVTGFSMDYLAPLAGRTFSFKEFMEEWIVGQYTETLRQFGLERPFYWETFVESLDYYHHLVYASAYTYRASVWFDFALPSPDDRAWLAAKYPRSWPELAPIWDRISQAWQSAGKGTELGVHGTSIIGFCDLCQIVLSSGTTQRNDANVLSYRGRKHIFCSAPCRWIFEQEPERYRDHKGVVMRVLEGAAPANLLALLSHFGLSFDTWGKDVERGAYPWLAGPP